MKLCHLFEALTDSQVSNLLNAEPEPLKLNNIDPHKYWTSGQIEHMARYARYQNFPTEQAARDWVEHKLNHWDKSSFFGGANGPEKNKIIASLVPIVQIGKNFKIGKRVRDKPKKPWEGVDIERPSIDGVIEAGFINPFDGYKVLGVKMVPTRLLHMTEKHSETASGQQKVYRYAQRIKDDETFLAIICDQDYTILDGHHRFRAVADVLKWKKIPCLVIHSYAE